MTTTEKRCTCTGPLYPKSFYASGNISPDCPWHGKYAAHWGPESRQATHRAYYYRAERFAASQPVPGFPEIEYAEEVPLPDPPPPTREDELEAENARLEKELMYARDGISAHTYEQEISELNAENKQLRAALEQYADKNNWVYRETWVGDGIEPWDVAREALK